MRLRGKSDKIEYENIICPNCSGKVFYARALNEPFIELTCSLSTCGQRLLFSPISEQSNKITKVNLDTVMEVAIIAK